jgi:3-deoxy-D-manno-octulosonic-acid transferase
MIMIVAGEWVKHVRLDAGLGMIVYSAALAVALAVAAPWWLWRMATSGRYREGLGQRLGTVPAALRAAIAGKRVVWLHAVSVGEVFAAARLVGELRQQLGDRWVVVVSTTTATGQKVAQERFGESNVFYFPLDFGWIVRRYLSAIKPALLLLLESELWPRLLYECERNRVPVAVVNARMSDRSFRRSMRMKLLWRWMGNRVSLWLAQGDETASRLERLGIPRRKIEATGNLKYDLREPAANAVAERIHEIAAGRPILVAGSTLDSRAKALSEEEMLVQAWEGELRETHGTMLVLAPRHRERFDGVAAMATKFASVRASSLRSAEGEGDGAEIVVLDTIGDLAAVYGIATLAFIGGSLVPRGGHNPLEAARFGVPVVMGPSHENFREIVDGMRAAEAIRITHAEGLERALIEELQSGAAMGERGRVFFESQAGATQRTVDALLELLH